MEIKPITDEQFPIISPVIKLLKEKNWSAPKKCNECLISEIDVPYVPQKVFRIQRKYPCTIEAFRSIVTDQKTAPSTDTMLDVFKVVKYANEIFTIYTTYKKPAPFVSARDFLVHSTYVCISNEDQISYGIRPAANRLFIGSSVPAPDWMYPGNNNYVRGRVSIFGYALFDFNDGYSYISHFVSVDPCGMIPAFLAAACITDQAVKLNKVLILCSKMKQKAVSSAASQVGNASFMACSENGESATEVSTVVNTPRSALPRNQSLEFADAFPPVSETSVPSLPTLTANDCEAPVVVPPADDSSPLGENDSSAAVEAPTTKSEVENIRTPPAIPASEPLPPLQAFVTEASVPVPVGPVAAEAPSVLPEVLPVAEIPRFEEAIPKTEVVWGYSASQGAESVRSTDNRKYSDVESETSSIHNTSFPASDTTGFEMDSMSSFEPPHLTVVEFQQPHEWDGTHYRDCPEYSRRYLEQFQREILFHKQTWKAKLFNLGSYVFAEPAQQSQIIEY
ncbi:hypothetical protein, conserved [Angomonas deanei]|uniref:START domain containing protein n=1 Tax=Angomonas deanei TaxID=59799 RepID=A0A7G2C0M1_9TRYP|nr:hypothetical protein, conserved [Angomonas deanei]